MKYKGSQVGLITWLRPRPKAATSCLACDRKRDSQRQQHGREIRDRSNHLHYLLHLRAFRKANHTMLRLEIVELLEAGRDTC